MFSGHRYIRPYSPGRSEKISPPRSLKVLDLDSRTTLIPSRKSDSSPII